MLIRLPANPLAVGAHAISPRAASTLLLLPGLLSSVPTWVSFTLLQNLRDSPHVIG